MDGEGRLRFLFKVLSAARALSIQVHPTNEQAEAGFEREEVLGIPLDALHRNYRDRSHKPELICALTPFVAMCGFRPATEVLSLTEALDVGWLDELANGWRQAALDDRFLPQLKANYLSLLGLDAKTAATRSQQVKEACMRVVGL
ncbi:type I phosphomannose isomerase catalytic subunit, partial [Arthrospira platensis SPKY1]|nr:type I phosphomannose isomerase catalytic subunit [Arthrospira platensis SPKY1]